MFYTIFVQFYKNPDSQAGVGTEKQIQRTGGGATLSRSM